MATGSELQVGAKPIASISVARPSAVGARASTATVTRSGTTFVAPGSTSTTPTVASAPSRAHSRTWRMNFAASTSASARSSIGVVPACAARPLKVTAPRACALTDYGDADLLDTLAAAYAEVGRFQDALGTARRALETTERGSELAESITSRIALYEAGRPYRDE